MARQVGAEVEVVGFGDDEAIDPQPCARRRSVSASPGDGRALRDAQRVRQSLGEVGTFAAADALYYVDFVALPAARRRRRRLPYRLGAVRLPEGAQPDARPVDDFRRAERAGARSRRPGYAGYDALAPWRTALADKYFPTRHDWQALAGLQVSLRMLMDEGLENVYARHAGGSLLPGEAARHERAPVSRQRRHPRRPP